MRNARPFDTRPPGARRVQPGHPYVWIRYADRWLPGFIQWWFVAGGLWVAWMQHDDPDPERPWAIWGMYLFDGVTIRQRHRGAAARIEDPGVEQTARLRDLGYAVYLGEGDLLLG